MGVFNVFSPDKGELFDYKTARAAHDGFLKTTAITADKEYEQAKAFNRSRPRHVSLRPCDKCGNVEKHIMQYKVHDYVNSNGEVFTDEWLARECRCCHYKWNEATINTK